MTTPNATRTAGGSPFGRIPSLTAQIRELIHDYPEGIGIIKELAQNADDAGARLLEIIIDRRTHAGPALPVPKMSALQGPALLFVNDSVFTDDDFDRIQEIYSSGKVRAADKTGQFGKGFNTVYNVTDWPSFVTGERVAFFDPHCSLIPGADRLNPGRYWTLAECWDQFPDLLIPFGAAGLEFGATRFEGTVFRLPFRTAGQAARSEISRKPFGEDSLNGLIEELADVRESLLLFLKRLESIHLREVSASGGHRNLVIVETVNVEEVRRKREELLETLQGDASAVVERLRDRPPVLVSYRHEFRSSCVLGENEDTATTDSSWRVLHCLHLDGGGKLAEAVETMLAGDVKAVPFGSAAARVAHTPDGESLEAVRGKVYCSLPLPIETGLPVHLNGFFDLDSSRHSLTTETGLTGGARIRARWNRLLVEHVVATAFAHLIDQLAKDIGDDDPLAYYAHWPRPDRPFPAPLDTLVKVVYRALTPLQVVRVDGTHRWSSVGNVYLLPDKWDTLGPPLVEDGLSLPKPALPAQVVAGFNQEAVAVQTVSPSFLRERLRKPKQLPYPGALLADAPRACLRQRAWLETQLLFCMSDAPKDLTDLPLALMADGRLRSFVVEPKHPIYAAGPDERELFVGQPHWFLECGFAKACGLDTALVPLGLYWMTPGEVVRCLPAVLPVANAPRLSEDGPDSPVPTAAWLTSLYGYLLAAVRAGYQFSQEAFRKIPLVPDQNGKLHPPGTASTPLLGREEEMKGLGGVLKALGVPLVTAPSALRDAIAAFATAVPNLIWKLTGPDLVDTLASLKAEMFPSYREDIHPPLLDFLAQLTWTKESYCARAERLTDLKSLAVFPTAAGNVVDLKDDTFIPGDFAPPVGVHSVKLLLCGPANAWVRLHELAGVQRLTRAAFIERYLLPEYAGMESADKLAALRWLRDNLARAQTELEEEEGAAESLREAVGATKLIRCEDGQDRSAVDVFDPDSELIRDLFGDSVPYPDRAYFERGWERWADFFRGLGLVSVPEAQDLLAHIDRLVASTPAGLNGRLVGRILKVFDHVDDHWGDLSRQRIEDEHGKDLASALRKRAWLPAEMSVRRLRRWPGAVAPESRLYRPDELCMPAQANLVCSQRPIFARTRVKLDVQRALGFSSVVPLDTTLLHFDGMLALWVSADPPSRDAFEAALHDIYLYFAGYAKTPEATVISTRYAGVACLWHRARLWHPEHAFRAKVPFFGDRRVTIHLKDAQIRHAYRLLGMREAPCLQDYLSYLEELFDKFGENSLPADEIDMLIEVYRRIGEEAPRNGLDEQHFRLLTENGTLVDSQDAFYADAPWFRDRITHSGVRFLHRSLPVTVTQLPWVRSLGGEVRERPTGDRSQVDVTEVNRRVTALESLVRSPEFQHGVARLVYHEYGKYSSAISGWLAQTSVVALRELRSELVLTLGGEDVVVGSGPANQYVDAADNRIFLDGTAGKLTRSFLAEAVNMGLSEHRLKNLSPLETILECEPGEIDQTLTRLRIKPVDDETAFARPEIDDELIDDSDDATAAIDEDHNASQADRTDPAGDEQSLVVDPAGKWDVNSGDEHLPASFRPASARAQSNNEDSRGDQRPSSTDVAARPTEDVGDRRRVQDRPVGDATDIRPPVSSTTTTAPNGASLSPPSDLVAPPSDPISRAGVAGESQPPARARALPTSQPTGQSPQIDPELRMRRRRDRNRRDKKRRRQDRIVTYVSFGPHGEPVNPADVLPEAERLERIALGDAAADLVCTFEREHGRSPVKLAQTHPGWDIDSFDVRRVESGAISESPTRMIEVKGVRGPWSPQGVAISRRQFESAREYGDRYWLYVVELADDPARARIHPIQNPYARINQFWFDGGWRQLADPAEAPSATCQLVAGQCIMVANLGDGVVERVEERGALRVVHLRLKDGTLIRRPFNPTTMRPAGR